MLISRSFALLDPYLFVVCYPFVILAESDAAFFIYFLKQGTLPGNRHGLA